MRWANTRDIRNSNLPVKIELNVDRNDDFNSKVIETKKIL